MINHINLFFSDSPEQIGDGWFSRWFYDQYFLEIGEFRIAKYAICILIGILMCKCATFDIITPKINAAAIKKVA